MLNLEYTLVLWMVWDVYSKTGELHPFVLISPNAAKADEVRCQVRFQCWC